MTTRMPSQDTHNTSNSAAKRAPLNFDLALMLAQQYATRLTNTRYDEVIRDTQFGFPANCNDNHRK